MALGNTENYNLPQWQGNDLTDWYDFNQPFQTIDRVMKENADGFKTAQQTADSNTTSIANVTQSLNSTIERVGTAESNINSQRQQITLNTTHLNEHDTAIQTINTQITALEGEVGEGSGEIASLQADVTELQGKVTVAQRDIAQNTDNIGDINQLSTTNKENLVGSINSLYGNPIGFNPKLDQIGNLNELDISADDLVDAINTLNAQTVKGGGMDDIFSVTLQLDDVNVIDANPAITQNTIKITTEGSGGTTSAYFSSGFLGYVFLVTNNSLKNRLYKVMLDSGWKTAKMSYTVTLAITSSTVNALPFKLHTNNGEIGYTYAQSFSHGIQVNDNTIVLNASATEMPRLAVYIPYIAVITSVPNSQPMPNITKGNSFSNLNGTITFTFKKIS